MKDHLVTKILLTAGAAITTAAVPLLNRMILSDAVPFADRGMLLQIALLSVLCGVVTSLLSCVITLALLRERYDVFERVYTTTLRHILSLPPFAVRNITPGDLTQRLRLYAAFAAEGYGGLALMVVAVIIALPAYVQMFFFLPTAAFALTGFLLLAFGAHALAYRYGSREQASAQRGQGQFIGLLTRFIDGIEKIRAACAEEACFGQLSKIYVRLSGANRRAARYFGYAGLFSFVSTSFGLLAMYVATVVLEGTPDAPTAGDCIGFVSASGIVAGAFQPILAAFETACQYLRARHLIRPFLEMTPEESGGSVTAELQGDVEMLHVTYSYDGHRKILDDVSIKARPGEVIALVGPSGAGKSTIIRLLLGFDRPESGEIHYDGSDIRSRDLRALRRNMGVVMQNAAAAPTSILSNILGSAKDLTVDDAWAAAEAAAVADDIRSFPMGMQTILSPTSVSGGQRQRILIARALVRKPKVLIFDEATSALDNISQRIVNRALISQIGVTEIIVAHRLSTIRAADRIYVLDRGRVVEEGTYDKLLAQGGLFTKLAKRQLAGEQ